MKKIICIAATAAVAFSACKKDTLSAPAPAADGITYMLATVPAPEPHNVLVEHFAGQSSSNSPAANDLLHSLETYYPNRINTINLYVNDFPQANPPALAKSDLRTNIATDIEQAVYQPLLAMPVCGIDRMPVGQVADNAPYQCYRASWSAAVAHQIAAGSGINLDVTSNYNTTASTATIKVKVTYIQPTSTPQSISIALVEDSLISSQEYPTNIDTAYQFNSVLRAMVTSGPSGDAFLTSMPLKQSGRVYERTYSYKIGATINPANCRLIAFVHKTGSSSTVVYQSKQTKLIP